MQNDKLVSHYHDKLEAEREWNLTGNYFSLLPKAVEYIASLPKEKQPIRGTEGGQYRRKQLMRQLPPHDQEPGACHDLTPQEKQEMDVFVTQYREKALGAGVVNEAGKIKVKTHRILYWIYIGCLKSD